MSRFTDAFKAMFARSNEQVLTVEDAAEIDDWVDEGGTAHPAGPPRVVQDPEDEASAEDAGRA